MKRTTSVTKEPDGVRIQNAFGNVVFIPDDELDDVISELVRLN